MTTGHLRINAVRIESFRAVSDEIVVHFSSADGQKAASCLLLGDNGTGKSTIIDAIEFALQGRIHPFFAGSNKKTIARVQNLATRGTRTCTAEVQLSDGSLHSRTVTQINASGDLGIEVFSATFT